MDSKPFEVRIDPNNKVLFSLEFNPGEDLLINSLQNSPNIVHRIRAAKELIKNGSNSALKRLDESLQKEEFYAVKYESCSALSGLRSPLAIQGREEY